MGKISRWEKKILIREAQQYQTYPSRTKSRRKNKNQLRKREMKERMEYETTISKEKQIEQIDKKTIKEAYKNKERIIVWIKDKEKNKEIAEKAREILEEKYQEKELIKESEKQFEEERHKPKYSTTKFKIIIDHKCKKCGSNSKWHGCVYTRNENIL